MFNFFLMLGKLGMFKETGLRGRFPRWYPKAKVQYDNGETSVVMAIGTAVEYATMFKGKVIRA